MKRQMLSSRLYHPQWWAVIADALQTVLLPNLLLVLSIAALWTQQWDTATLAFASYGSYIVALLLLAIALEIGAKPIIQHNAKVKTKLSPATIIRMLFGILTNTLVLWVGIIIIFLDAKSYLARRHLPN